MKKTGLLAILILGMIVEATNYQNLFYEFMNEYRPEWRGIANQIAAASLALFMLLNITVWGIRNERFRFGNNQYGETRYASLSYLLAFVTMIISFAVYADTVTFSSLSVTLAVTLILSAGIPFLVAYTAHRIGDELKRSKQQKHRKRLLEVAELEIENQTLQLQEQQLRQQLHEQTQKRHQAARLLHEARKRYTNPQNPRTSNQQRTTNHTPLSVSPQTTPITRTCLHCHQPLSGRQRKYCSDTCKVAHHRSKERQRQP